MSNLRSTIMCCCLLSLIALELYDVTTNIGKYLTSAGVNTVEELRLLRLKLDGEVAFHFYGNMSESMKVNKTLSGLVEKGRLYNLTLSIGYYSFKVEPTLNLQELSVIGTPLRVGGEFSLSCIAQGSIEMEFLWFKDGAYINESHSHRSLSFHFLKLKPGRYQYTLMITKADILDQGVYTCRVMDYDMEQCSSLHVSVSEQPNVLLIPMSVTVEKGEQVDLRCIPSDTASLQEKMGFLWLKNGKMLENKIGKEGWEDINLNVYNNRSLTGSVLQITDIQKTARYYCKVNPAGHEKIEKSLMVEVVANKSAPTICQPEGAYGVAWPLTNANLQAYVQCPNGAMGVAARECKFTPDKTSWHLPDFSNCSYREFTTIANNLKRLSLGYVVTNTTEVLDKLWEATSRKSEFRPGEGLQILLILEDVMSHLRRPGMTMFIHEAISPFYRIIDYLLSRELAITFDTQLKMVQQLVRKFGMMWAATLLLKNSKGTEDVSNLYVKPFSYDASSNKFKLSFEHVPWFVGVIEGKVDGERIGNHTFSMVVSVFRGLRKFFPSLYSDRDGSSNEIQYKLNSEIIAIDIGPGQDAIPAPRDSFNVRFHLEGVKRDFDTNRLELKCAVSAVASIHPTWNLTACKTLRENNATWCSCNRTGAYALMLVERPPQNVTTVAKTKDMPVLIGCICCLTQSLIAFIILLSHWWIHRTCIVFLKIQSCFSVAATMIILIYSVQYTVPKNLFSTTTAFLEIFLLLPLTAHLSIVLIIFTEVSQVVPNSSVKQSVVCITTGAPLLAVLTNLLGQQSAVSATWKLQPETMAFNVFLTCAIVTCGLFAFLFVSVLRKLHTLCLGNSDKSRGVIRRLGLVRRSAVLFIMLVCMMISSILYINNTTPPYQYFFGSTSALLGSVILLCYTVKSESPPHLRLFKKLKMNPDAKTSEEFSSESGISPLSFFTKQDGEQESESAAPRRGSGARVRSRDHHTDPAAGEQLLLQDKPSINKVKFDEPNTLETYVFSDSSIDAANNPNGSPSRYKPMSSFRVQEGMGFGEYVEQDLSGPVAKPLQGHSYILDPKTTAATEIITTRVCVELGVITTHQRNEVTGIEENAPALVVCSVDVEPCQSRIITPQQLESDPCQTVTIGTHMTHPCQQNATDTVEVTPAIVICSVDMDRTRTMPKLGYESEKSVAEQNSFCCGSAGSFMLEITGAEAESLVCSDQIAISNSVIKPGDIPEVNGHSSTTHLATIEEEQQKVPEASKDKGEADDNMDMMDRISHDLDYLLNRKSSPSSNAQIKKAGNVKLSILEDDEEDDETAGPVEYLAKC